MVHCNAVFDSFPYSCSPDSLDILEHLIRVLVVYSIAGVVGEGGRFELFWLCDCNWNGDYLIRYSNLIRCSALIMTFPRLIRCSELIRISHLLIGLWLYTLTCTLHSPISHTASCIPNSAECTLHSPILLLELEQRSLCPLAFCQWLWLRVELVLTAIEADFALSTLDLCNVRRIRLTILSFGAKDIPSGREVPLTEDDFFLRAFSRARSRWSPRVILEAGIGAERTCKAYNKSFTLLNPLDSPLLQMSSTPLLPQHRLSSSFIAPGSRQQPQSIQPVKRDGFIRSADMTLIQVYIPPVELANYTLAELGILNLVQFIDMNKETSALKRSFSTELKRCQEMLRMIRQFVSGIF